MLLPLISYPLRCFVYCSVLFAAASQEQETIHASVIISRTGERTPLVQQIDQILEISPLGAQQSYQQGTNFRNRYLGPSASNALHALSSPYLNQEQLYILTSNTQYTAASAQAFLQGLYPPTTVNTSTSSMPIASTYVPNGTVIVTPLGGYNYPFIRASSANDPLSVYVDGVSACGCLSDFARNHASSVIFKNTQAESAALYASVGAVLADHALDSQSYGFSRAYQVYDYLSYMYNHDRSFFGVLGSEPWAGEGALDRLRYYSDQSQWALYGDITSNISTIAGQTMAGQILMLLNRNVQTSGSSAQLGLLFVDHPPFTSFFALSGLANVSNDFTGLPSWGSAMAFELYSSNTSSSTSAGLLYPLSTELRVRLVFQNGTTSTTTLQTFPLFNSMTADNSMSWLDFVQAMENIAITSPGTWCSRCNSMFIASFCPVYNVTAQDLTRSVIPMLFLSPKTAGVIGAICTLAVVGIAFMLLVACGRLRLTCANRANSTHSTGSFKGGQKLSNDHDLPKAGFMTVPEERRANQVGSWEMISLPGLNKPVNMRSEYVSSCVEHEDDCEAINPFANPVVPYERV